MKTLTAPRTAIEFLNAEQKSISISVSISMVTGSALTRKKDSTLGSNAVAEHRSRLSYKRQFRSCHRFEQCKEYNWM